MKRLVNVLLILLLVGCSSLPDLSFLLTPTLAPTVPPQPTATPFGLPASNTPDLFVINTEAPTTTPLTDTPALTFTPTQTYTPTNRPTITLEPIDPSLFTPSPNLFISVQRTTSQLVWGSTCDGARSIKVYPNFRSKFLTKDLTVSVPVDRKEQIQKIIIFLDYSGSMDYDAKQIWVNAILIDRFKYVMKGEAEVFFSYFVHDGDRLEFQHIKNREDVINFWQTFSNDPSGGMTEVGDMVEHISNEISSGKLCNLDVNLSEDQTIKILRNKFQMLFSKPYPMDYRRLIDAEALLDNQLLFPNSCLGTQLQRN